MACQCKSNETGCLPFFLFGVVIVILANLVKLQTKVDRLIVIHTETSITNSVDNVEASDNVAP